MKTINGKCNQRPNLRTFFFLYKGKWLDDAQQHWMPLLCVCCCLFPVGLAIRIAMVHVLTVRSRMWEFFQTLFTLEWFLTFEMEMGTNDFPIRLICRDGIAAARRSRSKCETCQLPVCSRLCSVKWCLCLNAFGQSWHLYGRWPAIAQQNNDNEWINAQSHLHVRNE